MVKMYSRVLLYSDQRWMICTMVMGFNSNSMEIPSHFDEYFSSEENGIVDEYILSQPKRTQGHGLSPNFSVAVLRASGSKKGFKLDTRHEYRQQHSQRELSFVRFFFFFLKLCLRVFSFLFFVSFTCFRYFSFVGYFFLYLDGFGLCSPPNIFIFIFCI